MSLRTRPSCSAVLLNCRSVHQYRPEETRPAVFRFCAFRSKSVFIAVMGPVCSPAGSTGKQVHIIDQIETVRGWMSLYSCRRLTHGEGNGGGGHLTTFVLLLMTSCTCKMWAEKILNRIRQFIFFPSSQTGEAKLWLPSISLSRFHYLSRSGPQTCPHLTLSSYGERQGVPEPAERHNLSRMVPRGLSQEGHAQSTSPRGIQDTS